MSYCRVDDDSNVYVVKYLGQWEVRVQTNVQVREALEPGDDGAWQPWDHPLAATTYHESTLQALWDRLTWLHEQGVQTPARVYERIRRELDEGSPVGYMEGKYGTSGDERGGG